MTLQEMIDRFRDAEPVIKFATEAARDFVFPQPRKGLTVWISEINRVMIFDGIEWVGA